MKHVLWGAREPSRQLMWAAGGTTFSIKNWSRILIELMNDKHWDRVHIIGLEQKSNFILQNFFQYHWSFKAFSRNVMLAITDGCTLIWPDILLWLYCVLNDQPSSCTVHTMACTCMQKMSNNLTIFIPGIWWFLLTPHWFV